MAVKAWRWIHEVLHVFIDALHFPLKPITDTILSIANTNHSNRYLVQVQMLVKDVGGLYGYHIKTQMKKMQLCQLQFCNVGFLQMKCSAKYGAIF